jgi:5-methylcytosine-specific restriction endonuclease McrA
MSSRLAVLRRDKYVCLMPVCLHLDESGVLDRAIDPFLKAPDPWAPTIDHIVPRSLRGSSDPSNLRAAHAKCNQYAAMVLNRRAKKRARAAQRPQDVYDRLRQAERDSWVIIQDPEAVLGGPLTRQAGWATAA